MKMCEKCKTEKLEGSCRNFVLMAGKEADRKLLDSKRVGDTLHNTVEVSYSNITPISIDICTDCYRKHVKDSLIGYFIVILTAICWVPVFNFIHSFVNIKELDYILIVFALIHMAYGLGCILVIVFLCFDHSYLYDVLVKDTAKEKIKTQGLDTLWTLEEFAKLRNK